jgi:hypothetical protein
MTAVMLLVQDNPRKRRLWRKRQHDLGAVVVVAIMANVRMTVMATMTVVVAVVVTVVMPAISVLVMAIVLTARVVWALVTAIFMFPVRGERRRSKGQQRDQYCDSKSLSAIHVKSPFWFRSRFGTGLPLLASEE